MNRGVVWVSTVLYVLITLALISIALVAVKPVIDKNRDKIIVEQSLEMLERIEDTIEKVSISQGTRTKVEVLLKKGRLVFDASSDTISWYFDESNFMYTEPGILIKRGRKNILTDKSSIPEKWMINVTLNFSNYNLTINGEETSKILLPTELTYPIFIENKGNSINIVL